jgi:hypothetical protein
MHRLLHYSLSILVVSDGQQSCSREGGESVPPLDVLSNAKQEQVHQWQHRAHKNAPILAGLLVSSFCVSNKEVK